MSPRTRRQTAKKQGRVIYLGNSTIPLPAHWDRFKAAKIEFKTKQNPVPGPLRTSHAPATFECILNFRHVQLSQFLTP